MKKLLLTLALIMGASAAHADFSIHTGTVVTEATGEEENVIIYTGAFTDESAPMLDAVLVDHPEHRTIVFNSPGGVAHSAFQVGFVLNDHEVKTWVPKGRSCVSACAIAFLSGADYEISGQLAFHSAYIAEEGWEQIREAKQEQDVHTRAQLLATYMTYYIVANGFSFDLAVDINSLTGPNTFVTFRNEDDLLRYFAREDEGDDKIAGYFENANDPLVLSGEELATYSIDQLEDLKENSTKTVKDIQEIFNNFPKEEEDG